MKHEQPDDLQFLKCSKFAHVDGSMPALLLSPNNFQIQSSKIIRASRLFGIGHVTSAFNKSGEHLIGDFSLVNPKVIQKNRVNGQRIIRTVHTTTHFELPRMDEDHDHIIFGRSL